MMGMTTLVHEGRKFQNETVYVSGNSFYDCTFFRCTLVLRELPTNMIGCKLECCNWHIDILVTDQRYWDDFQKSLAPLVRGTLPLAFQDQDNQDAQEGEDAQ